ncbi:MAG: hypothetical protein LBS55_12450, partial [Prevotellaceae bacterium]|nr:hypothetical protein [Prevotellaceae bacterium]
MELLSFKGRPSALVVNVCCAYGISRIRINHHQVGIVAFADEAAFFDMEQAGGGVSNVIESLLDTMPKYLLMGRSINLG